MTAARRLQSVPTARRRPRIQVSPRRLEHIAVILGALLIVVGVSLIFPPAGLVVAGLALIASVIDLRPRRSRT